MIMMNNGGVDVVWELILPLNGLDTAQVNFHKGVGGK